MHNFFSKLFWGFVLIFLDINIGIDLLPDIVGFFLIAGALAQLPTIKDAHTARTFALVLGVLSIMEMPIFQENVMTSNTTASLSINLGMGIVLLCYYYYIFEVCLELLKDSQHIQYTKKVKYIMLSSVWLTMIIPAVTPHVMENTAQPLFILVFIMVIIAFFTYVIYVWKMQKYAELEEKRVVANQEIELENPVPGQQN